MRSTFRVLLGVALASGPFSGWAQVSPPRLLHHLNAGTRLIAMQTLIIPANADEIILSSGAAPGSACKLRVKEPKPFDRIVERNQALVVSGTSRAGFSAPRRISTTTYVEFDSRALDDLICVADRGSHEMTFNEFERVLAGEFSVQLPDRRPVIID